MLRGPSTHRAYRIYRTLRNSFSNRNRISGYLRMCGDDVFQNNIYEGAYFQ